MELPKERNLNLKFLLNMELVKLQLMDKISQIIGLILIIEFKLLNH
jgi:hypothetical protein